MGRVPYNILYGIMHKVILTLYDISQDYINIFKLWAFANYVAGIDIKLHDIYKKFSLVMAVLLTSLQKRKVGALSSVSTQKSTNACLQQLTALNNVQYSHQLWKLKF